MNTTSHRKRRAGAALIEFAVGSILFFIALLGAMDWALVFFQHQTILWRASDAARWASARTLDAAKVQNMVLCGAPDCTGSYSGFFEGATVAVDHVQTSDIIDDITTVTRYYARVTVSGYQVRQFTPFVGLRFTGRPIVAVQPMECQDAAGNCSTWN
ncbi:MAG: pilus assembly protein [Acidobacteria bacterium]|nr:pilus assembly protein [Acidobacteriota bacterium]